MDTLAFAFENKTIRIFVPQNPSASLTAVYCCCGEMTGEKAEKIFALSGKTDFCLVSFLPVTWENDYTPWPALSPYGGMFGGKAADTLDLFSSLIPVISEKLDIHKNTVLGYSLGGLMALWSMYESDIFSACACCSGSLWYDGFTDYAKKNRPHPGSGIYLSLGKSEHKTKNMKIKLVSDCTAAVYDLLKADSNVFKTMYVQNEGGHFSDIEKRLSLGIQFLTES